MISFEFFFGEKTGRVKKMTIKHVIGLDIGGTKTTIARYDATTWKAENTETLSTDAVQGMPMVTQKILELITKLRTPHTTAIGVGIAGLVQSADGVLLRAPHIAQSENVPLQAVLQSGCHLPVYVNNDAHCFALAEALHGAGKGRGTVLGITIGTGVGGGIVCNGKLFHGAHGFAGEFGHMLLFPGKPPYPTESNRGEVEEFISGTALGKRCAQAEAPADYLSGAACEFLRPDVLREIVWICASLSFAFDPSIIIFGGSAGRALKPHIRALKKELQQWIPFLQPPELAVAKREDAGVLGAALLTAND